MLWGNFFGFLAAITYFITIIPGLIRTLYPAWMRLGWAKFLLKWRRELGVLAFFFALLHGSWIVWERNLNLFSLPTLISYIYGISMSLILTILAITSNDFSVKKFKKNWKKLHNFTFLILILLPLHVLDKMANNWTILTYFNLSLSFFFFILSSIRLFQILKTKKF
jgi:methionine sulfoxide reductase heme-binding subunit